MASRKESESIDKRNAAVMALEQDYSRVVASLVKIVEGWCAIPEDIQVPDQLNDGRMEEAKTLLQEIHWGRRKL